MPCRIRYLNSAGVHPNEGRAIEALAAAFPSRWLLYASLQCNPPRSVPIEIDVMLVIDDRVLLLDLKDLNGELTANGDQWQLGNRKSFRSPVDVLNMHARKVATLLQQSIEGWKSTNYVDARIVLTGSATKANLTPQEQAFVLDIQEACRLADNAYRMRALRRITMPARKPLEFEAEFERVTRNPKLFQPRERLWGGYRAVDTDVVVHPRELWREHQGERARDTRNKALIRVWEFDKLQGGLNTPDHRRLIADREPRALARLEALNSKLVPSGVLMPIGEDQDEVLTQHHELRRLPPGWVTLDRFLERTGEALTADDRKIMAATLVNSVAELHNQGIAHRDLGPRCVWVGDETAQALTGFMACQMPDERSVGDWLPVLRGHSAAATANPIPGKAEDVRAVARLILHIFSGFPPTDINGALAALDPAFGAQIPWLQRALADDPRQGFQDALEAKAAFGETLDLEAAPQVDQRLLDRAQTNIVPYTRWPVASQILEGSDRNVYRAVDSTTGRPVVVKVWFGWTRGRSLASDLALMRLFRGIQSVQQAQRPDLPKIMDCGLSGLGAFIVCEDAGSRPWTDPASGSPDALQRCVALLRAIGALHDMDLDHGDLSPRNVLLRSDHDVLIIDLFDHSGVGDGLVRAGEVRPDNAEFLTPREVDRYAATKMVHDCLAALGDAKLDHLVQDFGSELERDRIEALEPLVERLTAALEALNAPARPRVEVHVPHQQPGDFAPSGSPLFGRAFARLGGAVEYVVFGPERELGILVEASGVRTMRIAPTPFKDLSLASEVGLPLELDVVVTKDARIGPDELLRYLEGKTPVVPLVRGSQLATSVAVQAGNLEVAAYWRRLLALEEEHQPTVLITGELSEAGEIATYSYERIGLDFDFDPEDQVEVRLPGGAKVGDLELAHTDTSLMTVHHTRRRRLVAGDRVLLVERRNRTSFDRRQKAVERVLKGESAIEQLIGYFSPSSSVAATDFGVEVTDKELEPYGLNDGQKRAFRHVARYGPVALQQGPPGTGKTRFIAALVHWLITKQGAGKILIASQSHEAVNNAIEALVDLYRRLGGERPSLLRIGSKGITDKIRPFHTGALRDRYRVRFEAATRHRIGALASAMGVRRAFAQQAADLDRSLGDPVRRVLALQEVMAAEGEATTAEELRRNERSIETAREAMLAAAAVALDGEPPVLDPLDMLSLAFDYLAEKHPGLSQNDIRKTRHILDLSREWTASLASSHRNFEEFLAKTRTVVTATCVGVGQTKIRIDTQTFDWVIVDEAARCTSSELAVPVQVGQRVLLVGDHLQLKPMIDQGVLSALSDEMPDIAPEEFERSDFERAFTSSYGCANGGAFDEQYRMAPAICDLVGDVFYKPHAVELRTSEDREGNAAFADLPKPLDRPVTWIDTSKAADRDERPAAWNKHTFWNAAEVDAILRVLERIAARTELVTALAAGDEETPIGVICMYAGQRAMLEQAFAERSWEPRFRRLVRVDTVDSYQGKENTVVILSLVRSNPRTSRGHVASFNRCNVALSRAKERLFIVGDRTMWAATPAGEPMRQVLDYVLAGHAGVRLLEAEAL